MSENESGLVAVRPAQPLCIEIQCCFICARAHDITVDRFEKRLDESWLHGLTTCEFVGGLEPVDAPVLSSDESVEARGHVDRYARINIWPHTMILRRMHVRCNDSMLLCVPRERPAHSSNEFPNTAGCRAAGV